jgi:hypothetical protein
VVEKFRERLSEHEQSVQFFMWRDLIEKLRGMEVREQSASHSLPYDRFITCSKVSPPQGAM